MLFQSGARDVEAELVGRIVEIGAQRDVGDGRALGGEPVARRQLRIVKMPATVGGISDNAFRNCKLLNSVTAPGCREFGCKAFEECCSLQSVYTLMELPTSLAAPPSLGITSLEAASTLPNLPCTRVPPQTSCRSRLPQLNRDSYTSVTAEF